MLGKWCVLVAVLGIAGAVPTGSGSASSGSVSNYGSGQYGKINCGGQDIVQCYGIHSSAVHGAAVIIYSHDFNNYVLRSGSASSGSGSSYYGRLAVPMERLSVMGIT